MGGPSVVLVAAPASAGLSKIKHVIVIMQENRSFDHYFGMYPGADGIPVDGSGNPTVCVNDPKTGQCVYPWHDPTDITNGGPHGARSANNDINHGLMNGYLSEYEAALQNCKSKPNAPDCGVPKPEPAGKHRPGTGPHRRTNRTSGRRLRKRRRRFSWRLLGPSA